MAIMELSENLQIISNLGDNPNADNNLTAQELKAMFDAASLIIQAYINGTLVPAVNQNSSDVACKLSKSGDTMEGTLNMNGNLLSGVPIPNADDQAANKAYVEKRIVDITGFSGKHCDLNGLDDADQHPISAIIGLATALARTDVDAGTTSKPVFFSGGSPRVCTEVDLNASSATKLKNKRTFQTNLGSTSKADFDGSDNATPGVIGTLPVSNGGTGATNGSAALKNLLSAGSTVLSPYQYGNSLPTAGTKGRIFFKKVSS